MSTSSTHTSAKLLVETKNQIKTITLNHPQAKNAIDKEGVDELRHAVSASYTDDTRVIILTGAGGNFCSGADLAGGGVQDPKQHDVTKHLKEEVHPIVLAIRHIDIPVIAKVRGVAAGLGLNFALACDMVFATPDVLFSQIFTNIALSSDGGGAYFMPRMMGYKKAFELMVNASKIKAEEALALGMINQIIAEEEIDNYVQNMAEKLATGPFVAIQCTKANLREGVSGTLESTLNLEAENQARNFQTEDFIEGVTAFMQKRKPNYKGK